MRSPPRPCVSSKKTSDLDLIGPDGKPYASARPGTRGGYVANRVFFLNERHARAAGYRPCKVCFDKRKKRSAKKTAAK